MASSHRTAPSATLGGLHDQHPTHSNHVEAFDTPMPKQPTLQVSDVCFASFVSSCEALLTSRFARQTPPRDVESRHLDPHAAKSSVAISRDQSPDDEPDDFPGGDSPGSLDDEEAGLETNLRVRLTTTRLYIDAQEFLRD